MVSSSVNDLALLERYAARGDAGAFAELVGRHGDMVFATARRVTRDATIAEDVSQDCFLSLAQRSSSIRGSLAAWLHRTSLNRSLEVSRVEHARRVREARAAAEHAAAAPGTDDAERLITRVDEALATLPDDTRDLITEHYLCGRTQADLAVVLGVHQSTVQRRIEKGLRQLRRRLGDDDRATGRALPLLLSGLRDVQAPPGLRQALIKIGLSGVGPAGSVAGTAMTAAGSAAASLAGKLPTSKLIATFAAIAFTGVGVAVLVRGFRLTATSEPSAAQSGEVFVTIEQLPTAARTTVEANAPPASVREIEKKRDRGRTVYDVDFRVGDRGYELRIADDGTLIWKKPS